MRVVQSIAPDAIGSEHYDQPLGKRYAAFEGIVYDLAQIRECLSRMSAMVNGEVERDNLSLAAYTWQAVILYARCFDPGAQGRQGTLGDRAVRTFSNDEATLHAGLLDVRDERFAHAGPDARHRCVLHMFERDGTRWLAPGFEIETPTGMFDDGQIALMQGMVQKLGTFADQERTNAREALERQIADPVIAEPICERLLTTRRQATPEAQALAILRRAF